MRIDFFEEFPSNESLAKLELINFPCKVYLASKSYEQFQYFASTFAKKNVEFGWWPLFNKEHGYWFSPFVPTSILRLKLDQLKRVPLIMWDAEFPKNRFLLFNFIQFRKNKKLIRNFFKKYSKKIIVAENMFSSESLGLHFPNYENKIIKMYYSSMHSPFTNKKIKDKLKSLHSELKDKLVVGLGCTDIGVLGNEPIITPKALESDLKFCKSLGIEEVVIFRLSGLNKDYVKVLNKFK